MTGLLRISLLGKLDVSKEGHCITGLETAKAQELLAYLLLHRDQPHPREKLAALLWENSMSTQAKGYLRQTLWQIQSTLGEDIHLLATESHWVQIDKSANIFLDVACVEQAFTQAHGIPGKELNKTQADILQNAVDLYHGDLLDNWYQDWCLFERERLQNIYLSILEKLVGYCEAHRYYDAGVSYATKILRCDLAHERTYRCLMRLHYLAGNRTTALRTYERCVTALDEELGIAPSQHTNLLYKQIQSDLCPTLTPTSPVDVDLPSVLDRLLRLQETLLQTQRQVTQELDAIRSTLHKS